MFLNVQFISLIFVMVMHVKTFKIYIAKKKSFMVIKSCCMFVKTYFQILLCLIKFWRFINCFFSHNHSSLSVLDITKVWHCNPTYISSLFHFSGSLGTIPNSSCERGSRIVCMWGQFYSIWLQSLTADMRYCSPKTDCWGAGASTVQYSDSH